MSALKPSNDKYRRSWLTWGKQMIPSKEYCKNYENINWGESSHKVVKRELTSPNHYEIRFEQK